eukprot:1382161-Amorphochlora_amoeboformis.AAC.1
MNKKAKTYAHRAGQYCGVGSQYATNMWTSESRKKDRREIVNFGNRLPGLYGFNFTPDHVPMSHLSHCHPGLTQSQRDYAKTSQESNLCDTTVRQWWRIDWQFNVT